MCRTAMENFDEAQQNHERMRGELKDSRESLDIAIMDCHDAATETKRKADDAHDQVRAHRDRCRGATTESVTAEEDLNDCLGRMDQL